MKIPFRQPSYWNRLIRLRHIYKPWMAWRVEHFQGSDNLTKHLNKTSYSRSCRPLCIFSTLTNGTHSFFWDRLTFRTTVSSHVFPCTTGGVNRSTLENWKNGAVIVLVQHPCLAGMFCVVFVIWVKRGSFKFSTLIAIPVESRQAGRRKFRGGRMPLKER